MKGTISFEHDTENDIVIVNPQWNIETKDDCEVWYNQWVDYISKFNRKMDVVMILNDFNVKAGISVEWGKYRAKLISEYTRFSYRVNPNLTTGIFIKTSGNWYNVSSNEANTVEAAIHAIIEDRKKARV